jgi:tRNA(adenine34) deaminase
MMRPDPGCRGNEEADHTMMRLALEQAALAAQAGDVPVGAVLVDGSGNVLGLGGNRREQDCDPTAHAEMVVLRSAARSLGTWHLGQTTLYVTLEPCAMCAGAMVAARVARLVYGAPDRKAGAVDSLFGIGRDPRLNHRFTVTAGVLEHECADQLARFFACLR